jgi:uncharacterized protein with PhoU and TrkA domain
MAVHVNGQWTFNPPDDFMVGGGAVLVIMANPNGRVHLENLLRA